MKGTSVFGRLGGPCRLYVAAGAAVALAYLLFRAEGTLSDVLFMAAGASTVVAILVGVHRHRPSPVLPWALFAVAMVCFTVIDAADLLGGSLIMREILKAVAYALTIVALVALIYSRKTGRDRANLIDSAIVVIGAGTVSWIFLMAPFATDASIPLAERVSDLTDPVALLVLLSVSVRLAMSPGARTPSFFFLTAAMLLSFATSWLDIGLRPEAGSMTDAVLGATGIFVFICAGAGALHPSMRRLGEGSETEQGLTRPRVILFVLAALAGPAAYGVAHLRGIEVHEGVVVGASAALFLLVLIRLVRVSARLRDGEARFKALVRNSSDVTVVVGANGVSYVSPAVDRVLGLSTEEAMSGRMRDGLDPDTLERVRLWHAGIAADPQGSGEIVVPFRRSDGQTIWLHASARNAMHDPNIAGVIINYHDISDRVRSEQAMVESEAKARLLFESSPLPMWVYDRNDLSFLAVNDAAVARYGYSRDEFMTMTITQIRPPEDVPELQQNLARQRASREMTGPWRHQAKGGEVFHVEIASHELTYGNRPAALVAAMDVSERIRMESEKTALESQLRQAQKMEAVGRLAGGVAHDFNNLLSVIQNYGRFVQETLEPNDERYEDMGQVLDASERAANLVSQLLTFSRPKVADAEVIDVNRSIEDVERMLRRGMREDIALTLALDPDLSSIEIDRDNLEQIVINLVVNASDALPSGGDIMIATRNAAGGPEGDLHGLPRGDYVVVEVTDTGAGIAPEALTHIFEPFFTTKAVGQGTGLGLATVYGLVNSAGGRVSVRSQQGEGTTFTACFPASNELAAASCEVSSAEQKAAGSGERVLVVEDEPGVRNLVQRILSRNGYEVIAASSGAEAIELVTRGDRPQLVLTDVVMPSMSGVELARRLREVEPSLRTVFMSGYAEEVVRQQGSIEGLDDMLQKPFTPEQVLDKVRAALSAEDAIA